MGSEMCIRDSPNPGVDCKGGEIKMGLIEVEPGHWVDQCCAL